MNKVVIEHIPDTIMKAVDFAEDEIYLTICGKVRYNVYEGEDYRDEKKSASDMAVSEAPIRSMTRNELCLNYITDEQACQGGIL